MSRIYELLFIGMMAAPALLVDPCTDFSTLPNEGLRYQYFETDPNGEVFQDTYLQEGWYRSCEPMLDHPPHDIYTCGTKFPIWLPGAAPTSSTPVDLSSCQADLIGNCTKQYDIQAAMCPDGCYRYNLGPTVSSSGYCFGVGVEGESPQYVASKPEIIVDLMHTEERGRPVTSTRFTCAFAESSTGSLLYIVHWYMNGRVHYTTSWAESNTSSSLILTEEVFVDKGFTLGKSLACSVTAFYVEKGPPGPRSLSSDSMFAGIRIREHNLDIDYTATDTVQIQLEPTIPIGCHGSESCDIRLIAYMKDTGIVGECKLLAFNTECGKTISSDSWNATFNITVKANLGQWNNPGYNTFTVYLKVTGTSENKIWGDYELETVSVTISTGSVEDGSCSVKNDPHIKTKDRRFYDDHTIGTKTIYWHPELNTEVQISTKLCPGTDVRCLCGVAARAGLDVYVWDICDGTHVMGYQYCDGDGRTLTVKVTDDNNIKIYFSYGTYVKVKKRGQFLEAYVYPTAVDTAKARGMCGNFDDDIDNEFHFRNGTIMSPDFHINYTSTYESRPTDFTNEWLVLPGNDLFNLTAFNESNLEHYEKTICICEDASSGTGGTSNILDFIPCTPNGAAKCKQGRLLQANHCEVIETSKRRRRSVEEFRSRFPRVTIGNLIRTSSHTRIKREVWTAESSLEHCTEAIQVTDIYRLCSLLHVDSLNLIDNVDTCAVDLQLTQTTDWVPFSINSLATECYETLLRNVTLVREAAMGTNSLINNINQTFCSDLDCSNQGTCENGTCVCDIGFAGDDCSVDLSVPPSMAGLLDGGLCDARVANCSEAFVFGGQYVQSDALKVKIESFVIDENGTRTYTTVSIITPDFQTYIELKIVLGSSRKRRSTTTSDGVFVSGYTFSVTNDGQQYSETADFFMYDSDCQQVQEINGTLKFTLLNGYCFIENQCVNGGQINTGDSCLFCNATGETRQWSLNSSNLVCVPTYQHREDDSSDIGAIIGGTIGALMIIVGIVVVVIVIVHKIKSSNSTRPSSPSGASTTYSREGTNVSASDVNFSDDAYTSPPSRPSTAATIRNVNFDYKCH